MPNTARWYAQGLIHAHEIVMREMQGVCPTKQRPPFGALATLPSHTASFAAFTGRALMTFRAGLALNSIGSTADPVIQRRNKLIVRLQQQIALVQDPQFTLTRQKWIADENGVKQLRELRKKVRAWWRTDT